MKVAFWIVAAELLFAWVVSWSVGHYARPPAEAYLLLFAKLLTAFGTLVLIRELIRLRWAANPLSALRQRLIANSDLVQVIAATIGLCILQKTALTWLKPALPMVNGFWADPPLADAEAAIFGIDLWRAAHFIGGPHNIAVDVVYSFWFPVVITTLVCASASRHPEKFRAILSYFSIFAVCIVAQFALPSAGPLFWGRLGFGDRFADLAAAAPPFTASVTDYLWRFYQSAQEGLAVGISAFPSVHVATAAWVAITVKTLWPKLFPFAAAWFAMILFGSVYLGWHYLLDGIAGTAIAVLAWKFAQVVLDRPLPKGAQCKAIY